MLLYNVRGPTSFEDLRTVDGVVYDTFQKACIKLGLFDDDSVIKDAFTDATSITTDRRKCQNLRKFFVLLVIECQPSDLIDFWEFCKLELSRDKMERSQTHPTEEQLNSVLLDLEAIFADHDKNMVDDYKLPKPVVPSNTPSKPENRLLFEETNYNTEELLQEALHCLNMMNEGQRTFYDDVMRAVQEANGGVYMLDSPAGCGKTLALSVLINELRGSDKVVLVTSTTAIAACLLPSGRTVHFKLKLPINLDETSKLNVPLKSHLAEVIRHTTMLVIDEVTMGSRFMFETIDRSFREIRECPLLFGGIITIYAGDWGQCLPVLPLGSQADIINSTLKSSTIIWPNVKVFHLTENLRVKNASQDDKSYAEFLLKIRKGKDPLDETKDNEMILIPPRMKSTSTTVEDFCAEIYPNLKEHIRENMTQRDVKDDSDKWYEWLMNRSIICPKNTDVELINDILIKQVEGEEIILRSADRVLNENEAFRFPVEFLNQQTPSGTPPHRLVLKVSFIIFVNNLMMTSALKL